MAQNPPVLLSHALSSYLETRVERERQATLQQELGRFIRWCGRDRAASSLTPLDVEGYCGAMERAGGEGKQRLVITKEFLVYLHRQGWAHANLAPHVKLRRTGRKAPVSQQRRRSAVARRLTSDGHQRLQGELVALKAERVNVAEEISRAAATKDFSENAPLDAARERQGQLEARIRELEGTLNGATVLDGTLTEESAQALVDIGSRVVLKDAQTGKEVSYLLVESSEADPAAGKLSAASPVGKALLDHAVSDEVEVVTPRGVVRYVVTKVGG